MSAWSPSILAKQVRIPLKNLGIGTVFISKNDRKEIYKQKRGRGCGAVGRD